MKLNRSILLQSVLAVMVLAAPAAFACGGHGKGCCGAKDMAWKQDAKFEVVNLDKGAKVTITAEKAEVVKAIQEHFAQMSKDGCKHGKEEAKVEDNKVGCKHGKEMKDCSAWMKNAKFESSKLDNGMVLTVTTEKADAVKDLQAHFADMGACKHSQQKQEKAEGHHDCPFHKQS